MFFNVAEDYISPYQHYFDSDVIQGDTSIASLQSLRQYFNLGFKTIEASSGI